MHKIVILCRHKCPFEITIVFCMSIPEHSVLIYLTQLFVSCESMTFTMFQEYLCAIVG